MRIARAVPAGSRRAAGQRQWKTAALAAVAAQGWYANRAASTAAVIGVLARYMDWADRTSRPTHARIAQMAKVSPSTVTRSVTWLRSAGLLGLVSPGATPALRPGVLHGLPGQPERNDAAVYVLTIPHRYKRSSPAGSAGHSESDTYPGPVGTVISSPARARAPQPAHPLTASCGTARKPALNGWQPPTPSAPAAPPPPGSPPATSPG